MFRQLMNMIKMSRADRPNTEPSQPQHTSNIDWQPLDASKLNITSQRLRQIEASMAEKARAEFAAVTKEFNSNQLSNSRREVETN